MANVNPSPKARFIGSANLVKTHRSLIERDDLQTSLDFALMQYSAQLSEQSTDANGAAASHFKLRGAHEFIAVFKNLAEMPQIVSAKIEGQLDHKA